MSDHSPFSAIDIIRAKRDGHALSGEHIAWAIDAYTRGAMPDEQMAALAMAIFHRGMENREIFEWTNAMVNSGDVLTLTSARPTVDKHSTGGVGDKITLPLVPLMAACGAAVPQLSGRGLGHTGGTLDKLEAIPGWRAELSVEQIMRQLDDIGAVICAATPNLAPADRKLYALRDVTGTVESIPLIASSIMSKKIAEGADSVVLDVKVGLGAFMKTLEEAENLAQLLVDIASSRGIAASALLTDMNTPLGTSIGNGLEVAESVDILRGQGPRDVRELTLALAREMLRLTKISDVDPEKVLDSGEAYEVWLRMIRAQGGDPEAALPVAKHIRAVYARESGIVSTVDAYRVGMAVWRLGAGRATQGAPIHHAAGMSNLVQPGARVAAGDVLAELHTDAEGVLPMVEAMLRDAIHLGDTSDAHRNAAPAKIGGGILSRITNSEK